MSTEVKNLFYLIFVHNKTLVCEYIWWRASCLRYERSICRKTEDMPGTMMISTWTHAIAYFTYMWRRKIRRLPVCTDQNSEWGDNEKKYNRKTKVKKKRGRVWWHFNSPTKWNKKVIRSITTTTTNTSLKMWRVFYKSRKIGRMELIEENTIWNYKLVKGEKRYKVQPNLDSRTVLRNIIDRK